MLIALLFITLVVPLRLVFTHEETTRWVVIYALIDLCFLTDIVLTFFTSFTDEQSSLEETRHKRIAAKYIKTWLIFDIFSVIPFDYMLYAVQSDESNQAFDLFRFSKFARVYKLLRLTRVFKVFKLLKATKMFSAAAEKLSISKSVERLFIFAMYWLLFTHVSACLWILLAQLENENGHYTWINDEEDPAGFDLYFQAFYFTVTTASTVGYGDIGPTTSAERIFCTILMILGVTSFSFVTGSLSSIVSSYDTKEAELSE